MVQHNPTVSVVANDRIIDVPQSYVDRFPDLYVPLQLKQDGELRAKDAKLEDARGSALPPFATTPADLPAAGSSSTSTTPPTTVGSATSTGIAATTTGADGAGDTDGGATA